MTASHLRWKTTPTSRQVLEQRIPASMKLAATRWFSWIPPVKGMTGMNDLRAQMVPKFLSRLRGGPPPRLAHQGNDEDATGLHIPSFPRTRESTKFPGFPREWKYRKNNGLQEFPSHRRSSHRERRVARSTLTTVAFALLAGLPGTLSATGEDADLLRTWERAFVIVPGETGLVRGWIDDIDERLAGTPPPLPTVIYLHGCAGLGRISHDAAKLLAEAGYAVIMPDSFAREHKPKSCDPERVAGGLHRGVLGWRQAEANKAIREARRLAWVDPDNVFLWGFSEGEPPRRR